MKVTVQLVDGRTVRGTVAATTKTSLWIYLERVTGYWPVMPDPDQLYPVAINARSGV